MATLININEVTNATTVEDGTGIFDKLMQTAILHIEDQLEKSNLTQSESGQVYATTIQTAMQQAIQFVLQEKQVEADIALKEQQLITELDKLPTNAKQRELMDTQKALYARQTSAFDDNKFQKLLDSQLNYNGMVFQDADAPDVLDVALEAKVNDVFNKLVGNDPNITSMPEA